ncbi:thioesterase domain-containing protein [Planobispora takensis]|uniref:Thioesterase n=1 Tax=Planobispora takensis TaxID=1367882 RepID=A0A8J3T3W5_9ACTN|nr:thioesterase domain-containing protein [Planobispora takensis]GII04761.1 hypothetical protein Pta02_67690 [Planobispora takensis]
MREENALPDPPFASLTRYPPDAPLLFCLPYAGGDVSAFWAWRQAFDGAFDVRVVMLPGRAGLIAEPGALAPEAIARAIAAHLAAPAPPYAVYGHSMGARLAFEVVRELRRLGVRPPRRLYVGAAHPPERQETLARWTGLGDEELIEELIDRLGAPEALRSQPEVKTLLVPALRTDMAWLRGYRHTRREPLGHPIVAFAGAHDREVVDPEMLGWARHTSSWFRLHTLDAGHLFLNTHGARVAEAIIEDFRGEDSPERPGEDEVHIWLADLERLPEVCEATDELSPREAGRAARFRHREHRDWYVGRCVVLRRLLREYGVETGVEELRTRPGGKPYTGTDLTFSMSQSGGLVLVALAWGREVGADIERLRPLADEQAFCEGALDEREAAEFAALPEEMRLPSALRTWTAKEAVLKASGDGLRVDPALFGFAGQQPGAAWIPDTAPEVARLAQWRVTHLPLGRAIGAVAVRSPGFRLRFETVRQGPQPHRVEAAG